MKIVKPLFVILILVNHPEIFAQNSPFVTVAVSEFKTNGFSPADSWLGGTIADNLIAELTYSRYIRPVEREYLDKILNELALQQSGVTDPSTAVEVGKLLGAKAFIFGRLSKLDNLIELQSRVVRVENGEILGAANAQGSINNLLNMANQTAQKISAILAVEAAIEDTKSNLPAAVDINIYKKLRDIDKIYKSLPRIGLQPSRDRKKAEYYYAINELNTIIASVSSLIPAYLKRAAFFIQLENYQSALEDLQIAKRLDAKNPDVLFSLANYYYITDDDVEAEETWREFTRIRPEDSWGWFALGKLYSRQLEAATACECFLTAAVSQPILPEIENNLRVILQSDHRSAVITYLNSKSTATANLARMYISMWNNDLRSEILAKVRSEFAGFYLSYYASGLAAMEKGAYGEAVDYFSIGLSYYPEYPPSHREIGKVLIKTGKRAEGKKHLEIYLATSNYIDDFDEINRLLQR